MPTPFISYAQNLEDVMLWRALKHVDHGFYVDAGAASPVELSVTEAFYERGWHGVNIEPQPVYHRELTIARPLDVNLMVAAGDRTTNLTLYVVGETGLSTLDESEAEERRREGWSVVEETVRVESLASIWAEHVGPDQPVHFLKIDVEGFERQVLEGGDWVANRPWIVVVESTLPQKQAPSHDRWEKILTDGGYEFVYADGLNRFYVSGEHRELASAFEYPPNVFDDFVRISEVQAVARAQGAESRIADAEALAASAVAEVESIRGDQVLADDGSAASRRGIGAAYALHSKRRRGGEGGTTGGR